MYNSLISDLNMHVRGKWIEHVFKSNRFIYAHTNVLYIFGQSPKGLQLKLSSNSQNHCFIWVKYISIKVLSIFTALNAAIKPCNRPTYRA